MNLLIEKNKQEIAELCKQNEVNQLFAFGSVVSNKFNDKSDIDLLVDLKKIDPADYADNYFNLLFSFEKLFNRNVDLLTTNSLKNPYFIREIEKTKQLIYG